ncbi:MAG: peptidoglycan bridge formation glycyltransferase FemA/FemB family protein [Bacilli bacterium]|nr:peptidoglycan bridge formation glycyltransferase FemA/FemB family protein [Bacilli bacterium]
MKLIEISKDEFKKIADNHEQITFHQTIEWANLKAKNGWKAHFLELEENKKSLGCALILKKKIPVINKYMFYSPRGFLIDYSNKRVLKVFTDEIKKWAKEKDAIFIKIDPYLPYKEHDNNGDLVENGFDNSDAINNLKDLGYEHFGFNLMQDTLQPRWMHIIDTENKSIEDVMSKMESKTRQILRKNEKCGIVTREITKEELPIFKNIMQHTSDRREFVDRPMSYYENMWNTLHESGILKILIAEIDFVKYKENTKEELNQITKEYEDRKYKKENNILKMNEKKYNQKQKADEESINRLKKQIDKIKDYQKEYGNKKILGGILFLIYGNEVLSLYGGSIKELMQFQSAYTLHWEGIKYAIENKYKKYNFYGITGDFREENPLYGLYLFKKSFGGNVVELIGEFDLIINKPLYYLYKGAFACYHKIKNLKKKK